MSTDVAVINEEEKLAMLRDLGMEDDKPKYLPQLKINYKDENEADVKLTKGLFYVDGSDDEPVYAEEVDFRPLSMQFQYMDYDNAVSKMRNRTISVNRLMDETRDMLGTIRCGKPTSKILKTLPADEQKKYESIKCYRQVRGLVSYTGKTATGETKTIENLPVLLSLKGSNFSPFEDAVVKALPRGRKLYEYWIHLSNTKVKGKTTYWVIDYKPDFSTAVALDAPTFETMRGFKALSDSENAYIEGKYIEALSGDALDAEAMDGLEYDMAE
tara:strand:+ start:916 stop:1728 length:813 start_codon:yes stop_codon:yes gene_type:complete